MLVGWHSTVELTSSSAVGGAEHYYDTLAVCDKLLSTIFRPNKAINIGMLTNPSHYGMSCYVWADIVRSVALGYPTAFPYVFQPTTTHALTGTEVKGGSPHLRTAERANGNHPAMDSAVSQRLLRHHQYSVSLLVPQTLRCALG